MKIRLFNPIVFIILVTQGILQFFLNVTYGIVALNYFIFWLVLGIYTSGMYSFLEFADEYMKLYGIPIFYKGQKTIMYKH